MMHNFVMNYEENGNQIYLNVKVEEKINNYQLKMLENNEIPGLLRVHRRMLNGEQSLNYDVTGMHRLKENLESNQYQGGSIKKLLGGMLDAMADTEDYFLTYSQCYLDLEHIYIDEKGKAALVYLPLEETTMTTQDSLRRFFQMLLAEYLNVSQDPFFIDLLLYINRQEFSFAGLLTKFRTELKSKENPAVALKAASEVKPQIAASQPVVPEPAKEPMKTPLKAPMKTPVKTASAVQQTPVQEKKPEGKMNGIRIPGGSIPSMPEKKEKEKKEQKSLFAGLVSKPKKEPEPKDNSLSNFFAAMENKKVASVPVAKVEPQLQSRDIDWTGTIMVDDDGSSPTIMIDMEKAKGPCLHHKGRDIQITTFPFTVGRTATTYVISSNVVSKLHMRIICTDGKYYVQDENSRNHTWLNETRLVPYTPVELKPGDKIRVVDEELIFDLK